MFYESTQISLKEAVKFAQTMPRLKAFGFSSKREQTRENTIKELEDLKDGLDGLKKEAMNNFISSILPWKKPAENPKFDKFKENISYKKEEHPLVDFPEELIEIEELYLQDLRFKTLRLKKPLPKLTTLFIEGSVFKLSEPPRWEDFPSLKTVDLSLHKWPATQSEVKIIDSLQNLPKTVISLNLDSWLSFEPDIALKIQKIPKLIAHLEDLEYLSFYKSQIDVGLLLELLPKLNKLKELDLEGIKLSSFQKRKLRKILPEDCELSVLDD